MLDGRTGAGGAAGVVCFGGFFVARGLGGGAAGRVLAVPGGVVADPGFGEPVGEAAGVGDADGDEEADGDGVADGDGSVVIRASIA
ncbi:hypothetical protein [Micromonospora sp. LOL_021]|uniref:hypothetical protein n=1 Tax=Micromonospora sp. LOL_021 TaxID=3345417 RepID=UPI003A84B786